VFQRECNAESRQCRTHQVDHQSGCDDQAYVGVPEPGRGDHGNHHRPDQAVHDADKKLFNHQRLGIVWANLAEGQSTYHA